MVSDITAELALARMGPTEREAVEEFRRRVRELLGDRLRDLRLFGSQARGDPHDESDIDVLVLVDDLDEVTHYSVFALGNEIDGRLSLFTKDFEKYHAPPSRATGIYKEMRVESVRL